MATCTVSGTFLDPSETAIAGATITYTIESPALTASAKLLLPKQISTTTASDGTWSLAIAQSSSGILSLQVPPNTSSSVRVYTFALSIPAVTTATFASVWADSQTATASSATLTFANIAGQLATNQLPVLASTNFWVGNGSSVATAVAMSGDATMANTGAVTVATVGGSTAALVHSAELAANAATSANTASKIVARDASGNFTAGTITAALTGNVTGNCTGSAGSFTGSLSGDVTGLQGSTVVASVGSSTAALIHSAELAANAATSANTVSKIVARDSSGNFSAGTITATLTGTASGNTTYTATNHGVVLSGSTNAMTVLAPDASASKVLKSGGSSADPSWLAYTDANTASTIVARDASGNFTAGTITAALTGNASTATTATNATNMATVSTSSNATFFPIFAAASANGNQAHNLGTGLTFNPSTNVLSTTTFSGALTGTASGNTTYTANSHGVVLSGSGNAMTVLAPDASTAKTLISGGSSADPAWGTLAIGGGGTGQTSKSAAFDALSPMSASGDIVYGGVSGTGTRLAKGADGQYLKLVSGLPSWQAVSVSNTAPTVQKFTSTGTTTGYVFLVTSANATVAATYTNNAQTFTVIGTIAAGTMLFCTGTGSPSGSGTLTRSGGSGDATIAFSAFQTLATYTTPANVLYLRVKGVGGGAGGGGSGSSGGSNGGAGNFTCFGTNLIFGLGGASGLSGPNNGTGGAGGTASVGAASGFAVSGGSGGGATGVSSTGTPGGMGGSSILAGAGGGQSTGGGSTVNAATNSGSGGGGGSDSSSTTKGGGGGAGGGFEAIVTSPAGTYYYSVATAVSAGSAGTSGGAGGTGAAGQLQVEEHYQ